MSKTPQERAAEIVRVEYIPALEVWQVSVVGFHQVQWYRTEAAARLDGDAARALITAAIDAAVAERTKHLAASANENTGWKTMNEKNPTSLENTRLRERLSIAETALKAIARNEECWQQELALKAVVDMKVIELKITDT